MIPGSKKPDTSREGALDQGNLTRRRQVGSLTIGWHNCGGPRLGKPCQNSFSLRETLGFLSLASTGGCPPTLLRVIYLRSPGCRPAPDGPNPFIATLR